MDEKIRSHVCDILIFIGSQLCLEPEKRTIEAELDALRKSLGKEKEPEKA